MKHSDASKFQPFLKAIETAKWELSDSISTGNMSDSKSAVYDLPHALNAIGLTDAELHSELQTLSQNCWDAMYELGGGDCSVYTRAAQSIRAVAKLERRVKEVCSWQAPSSLDN